MARDLRSRMAADVKRLHHHPAFLLIVCPSVPPPVGRGSCRALWRSLCHVVHCVGPGPPALQKLLCSAGDHLEKVYFRIPRTCQYITDELQGHILLNVDRSSPIAKVWLLPCPLDVAAAAQPIPAPLPSRSHALPVALLML